jgi:regulatory protein
MATFPTSLKARALQWLAQREHSRVDLRRRLLRLARESAAAKAGDTDCDAAAADPAPEVDALLDWLVANHYLSDARFVESRVNARSARYGNLRIRQELSQHGTALDAVAAERLKDSELARAHAVWTRKYGGVPARAPNERARQIRFLAGRGFSADVIRRVIRSDRSEPEGPA